MKTDNIHELRLEYSRQRNDKGGGGNHTGGSDGGGSEMEARVAKLESHVEYMRRDISDMKADIKGMASDVVSLRVVSVGAASKLDHIDNHMVTKGQLALYALLTLLPVIGGGWWMVQQYLAPLLKALPH